MSSRRVQKMYKLNVFSVGEQNVLLVKFYCRRFFDLVKTRHNSKAKSPFLKLEKRIKNIKFFCQSDRIVKLLFIFFPVFNK